MKNNIKLFIMDVDGTMTDGRFTIDAYGNETKTFNVKDGMAIRILKNNRIKTAIITGRSSAIVEKRAENLGIDYYFVTNDKKQILYVILDDMKISSQNVAFIGDDINDLPLFEFVGHKACPNDAAKEVKLKADYICNSRGGYGAIREYVDYLLSEVM